MQFGKIAIIVTGLTLGQPAVSQGVEAGQCARLLVAISSDGSVVAGSRAALADSVQSGHSIRVGFGLGEGETSGFFLTHWFEAQFLTVLAGHVFTQTPIIHRQRPQSEAPDITLTSEPMRWVATLGTNGRLHSRFLEEEEIGHHRVDSWWCLDGS
jgi:hypothetical protein